MRDTPQKLAFEFSAQWNRLRGDALGHRFSSPISQLEGGCHLQSGGAWLRWRSAAFFKYWARYGRGRERAGRWATLLAPGPSRRFLDLRSQCSLSVSLTVLVGGVSWDLREFPCVPGSGCSVFYQVALCVLCAVRGAGGLASPCSKMDAPT